MIKAGFKLIVGFIIILFVLYFAWSYVYPKISEKRKTVENKDDFILVKRVVDGDTFVIDDGKDSKVRMLGIDTPELYDSDKLDDDSERSNRDKETIKKLGKLAGDYTKKAIEGKKVRLVREKNYEEKDRYGRLLRYVYLDDGTLLNKKIIEDGYAYAYRKYEISKLKEFIEAEREARENNMGLWSETEGLKQLNE